MFDVQEFNVQGFNPSTPLSLRSGQGSGQATRGKAQGKAQGDRVQCCSKVQCCSRVQRCSMVQSSTLRLHFDELSARLRVTRSRVQCSRREIGHAVDVMVDRILRWLTSKAGEGNKLVLLRYNSLWNWYKSYRKGSKVV